MKVRSLLLVLILAAPASAQEPISCEDGMCTLPQVYLAALVRQAESAQQYAELCGWVKEGR